jgi:hypothetical protein
VCPFGTFYELARGLSVCVTIESNIIQVKEPTTSDDTDDQEFSQDIFEVFATEKKHADKPGNALELSAPAPSTPAPVATPAPTPATSVPATEVSITNASRVNMQYKYRSNADDEQLVKQLEGKLALTTQHTSSPLAPQSARPSWRNSGCVK